MEPANMYRLEKNKYKVNVINCEIPLAWQTKGMKIKEFSWKINRKRAINLCLIYRMIRKVDYFFFWYTHRRREVRVMRY